MMLKILQNKILGMWETVDKIPWDFCSIYQHVLDSIIQLSKHDPTFSQIIGPYKRCKETRNMFPHNKDPISEFLELMQPCYTQGHSFGDYPGNATFEPHDYTSQSGRQKAELFITNLV